MMAQQVKWGVFIQDEPEAHVLPSDAEGVPMLGHEPSRDCFCCPTKRQDADRVVIFVHHLPY